MVSFNRRRQGSAKEGESRGQEPPFGQGQSESEDGANIRQRLLGVSRVRLELNRA